MFVTIIHPLEVRILRSTQPPIKMPIPPCRIRAVLSVRSLTHLWFSECPSANPNELSFP